jgi:IS30 family transposase
MANQLKMAMVETIVALRPRGWSQRWIARELGIDRETVARHLRLAQEDSKPVKAPTGSDGSSAIQNQPMRASAQRRSPRDPRRARMGRRRGQVVRLYAPRGGR